jgi:TolA-binding protein
MTIREIREGAYKKYALGEFEEAIPYLQMLIDTMKDIKSTQGMGEIEVAHYNLGVCYFLTGQFPAAEQAFTAYCKKYPHGNYAAVSSVYIGDSLRFASKNQEAIKAYKSALSKFSYVPDVRTDIHAGIARCYLAMNDWAAARAPLREAFFCAPDSLRRNRTATLLATSYLKTLDLDNLYPMIPYLLRRDSYASRTIVFNLAGLEAGDALFGDERYREALWVFRLVFPYGEVQVSTEAYIEQLKRFSEYEKRSTKDPRRLMRFMEWIGDAEAELTALGEMENYDQELFFRISRGYMESKRYREACEGFLRLHKIADKAYAEESLYLAFSCASRVEPLDRCYTIARLYMDEYPSGVYYDELTLLAGQLYARETRWSDVIRHFSEVLRVHPKHQMAAECLFLLGYAHFMEEQFEQAIVRFRELRGRFPGWDQTDAAIYWTGMSLMFASDYQEAEKEFSLLIQQGGAANYVEDGTFRRAVCNYALSQYDLADSRLVEFVKRYPEGVLRFEAQMVRADIAGTVGRTDDAAAFYQAALEAPETLLNIEYYNHCAFQAGQILYDAEKFKEVRSHFDTYIARNREGSNVPLAVYWSGRALFNLGEQTGALRYYRDAVATFGKDRKAMGVDLILDEWVATTRRLASNDVAEAWSDMTAVWKQASANNDNVGRLRYQRVLMYAPGVLPTMRQKIMNGLLQESNLKDASPAVMETMLDGAVKKGDTYLAVRTAEAILADYTETDIALDARMYLARNALEKARTAKGQAAEDLVNAAMAHLLIVRDVYATSSEAAEALLLLGTLHREQRKFDEAQKCFESVLGVKEWRSGWPEALHGLGLCAEARRDFLKATAYYERIYVMYGNYRSWTAKAYLRRAECLGRLYQEKKAKETLTEMLAQDELKAFPEYEEATKLLNKLEGRDS